MESRKLPYLLIAPSAAIFALLFVAPFVYFFLVSFWTVRALPAAAPNGTSATTSASRRDYSDVGFFTLWLALVIALLTTLAGFVYAYIIRFRAGRYGPLLLFIALVTLFGGYLMKIYAWKTILGNEGVLNSALISSRADRPAVHGAALQPGGGRHHARSTSSCPSRSCRSTVRCAASATPRSRRRAISARARWRVSERHPDPALPARASSPPSSSAS